LTEHMDRRPLYCEASLAQYARRAACLGLAFHALSYYEEDTGRQAEVTVSVDDEKCSVVLVDYAGCDMDSVATLQRSLPKILGVKEPLVRALSCSEDAPEALRYQGLAAMLVEGFRRGVLDCLKRLSLLDREYFYVAGWNGAYALGPGSERSVTLPSVPGVVFAHTHPDLCYPSAKDLYAFADFLAGGGIAEFIVSPSCGLAIYLDEPLLEEDYWLIIDVGRCVARARDGAAYNECLSRLSRLRSAKLQLV